MAETMTEAILALLVGAAWAGVPVVYDAGTPEEAVARVAQSTGLPPEQLDPTPLSQLLRNEAHVLGGAALRHCAGAPSRATEIRTLLVRAEAAWRSGDARGAMDQADLGIAGIGCLTERAETAIASRLFLLRGGLLASQGQTEEARAEIRTAISLQTGLETWEGLPPELAPLLEGVRSEVASASIGFVPRGTTSGPWVDGKDPPADGAPLALLPGLHLLQVPGTGGIRSAWLTAAGASADGIPPEAASLVVPGAFYRPVLERLADPATRGDVERLLLATLGTDGIYATQGEGVWLVGLYEGQPRTTTLAEPVVPVVEEKKGRRGRKRSEE